MLFGDVAFAWLWSWFLRPDRFFCEDDVHKEIPSADDGEAVFRDIYIYIYIHVR